MSKIKEYPQNPGSKKIGSVKDLDPVIARRIRNFVVEHDVEMAAERYDVPISVVRDVLRLYGVNK